MEELQAYPALAEPPGEGSFASVAAALNLVLDDGVLSLLSTTTVFGAPSDITLAELALEAFFPFDETTASTLRAIAAARDRPSRWMCSKPARYRAFNLRGPSDVERSLTLLSERSSTSVRPRAGHAGAPAPASTRQAAR
jgi:hypothetical protein